MIKAKCNDGSLLFGICAENVKRLKQGQPIHFNLKEMGLEDREILIMYGETEQDIMSQLINEDYVTTKTKINKE